MVHVHTWVEDLVGAVACPDVVVHPVQGDELPWDLPVVASLPYGHVVPGVLGVRALPVVELSAGHTDIVRDLSKDGVDGLSSVACEDGVVGDSGGCCIPRPPCLSWGKESKVSKIGPDHLVHGIHA